MCVGGRDMGEPARPHLQESYMTILKRIWRDCSGATAIEYALICGLVSIAAIVAMQGIGNQLDETFSTTSQLMANDDAAGG